MARLLQEWPNYKKPQSAIQIEAKLVLSDLLRAAKSEPKLKRLLVDVGLVEP
jgi:hypothetical protein